MVTSREWHLVRRPEGWPTGDDVALVERELPEADALADGAVLVRNLYLSVDPYMRGRMNAAKSYAPPYELNEPMYGGAVGRVEASAVADLPVGTIVRHGRAWREWAVCRPREVERLDPEADGVPLPAYLGVLGMPGLTAWVGTYDIGALRPGETFFVSAASGAVGSLAGQLARLAGCRVIGSAGGPEKVAYLVDALGFDAAVDHRAEDLTGQLAAAAPDGIDVYFDNVGGESLRAAIANLNPFGRIAVCGMISSYNERQPGPDNLFEIVARKLRVQGFIVGDHAAREPLFRRHVAGLLREGRIVYRETIRTGIESTFDALLDVLRGGHHLGKMVIELPAGSPSRPGRPAHSGDSGSPNGFTACAPTGRERVQPVLAHTRTSTAPGPSPATGVVRAASTAKSSGDAITSCPRPGRRAGVGRVGDGPAGRRVDRARRHPEQAPALGPLIRPDR